MNANVDISNVELVTERLMLHAWRIEDLEDFMRIIVQLLKQERSLLI